MPKLDSTLTIRGLQNPSGHITNSHQTKSNDWHKKVFGYSEGFKQATQNDQK